MTSPLTNPVAASSSMSASSIAAMKNSPSAGGSSAIADRADTDDKDTFLKLLVAQMRYQDPSKPADSSELMAQTATFSQVEKLTQLATQNAALLASQRTLSAGAMVGQTVSYTATDGTTKTGKVSSVRIATDAKEAEAVIDGTSVAMGRITTVSAPTGSAGVPAAAAGATAPVTAPAVVPPPEATAPATTATDTTATESAAPAGAAPTGAAPSSL